ncbi:MAG: FHA domain-containing protein [Polyangiales bacterium]
MAVRLRVRHPRSVEGEAGEVVFEFDQARIVIGRGPGADVRLPDPGVSEVHATIEPQGSHYAVRDEGSTNGTALAGAPLVPRRPRSLGNGDVIAIAAFTLTFHEGPLHRGPTGPERTASLARRMLGELLGGESEARRPPNLTVVTLTGTSEVGAHPLGAPGTRLVIGSGADADLVLPMSGVAAAHVELLRDLDGTLARDLARGGLEVNGRTLRERRLKHGDVLRIGGARVTYRDPAEEALRALERVPDVTLTRTLPAQPSMAPAPAAEPEPEAAEPPPEPEPVAPRTPEDLMVYALAMLVLGASLVGLVWLFK